RHGPGQTCCRTPESVGFASVTGEQILEPEQLRRYADAIIKASLGVKKNDVFVVSGETAHRELMVAVAQSAYRAGALSADMDYGDPLAYRARILHGTPEARAHVTPWRT